MKYLRNKKTSPDLLIGPKPLPFDAKGVFWGSSMALYLLISGPVAVESGKQPGIKLSGGLPSLTSLSVTWDAHFSVVLKHLYMRGLAMGSSESSMPARDKNFSMFFCAMFRIARRRIAQE